jgi:hypothetical protein
LISICNARNVQRLTVYAYERAVFWTFSKEAEYPELQELLKIPDSWKDWDDISALASHQTIKNHLMTCLESINKMPAALDHGEDVRFHYTCCNMNLNNISIQRTLAHALTIDAIAIDALLLGTLQDQVKKKQFVRRCGREAQSLLNLLQAVRLLVTKSLHPGPAY